jgi:hypothetical protein
MRTALAVRLYRWRWQVEEEEKGSLAGPIRAHVEVAGVGVSGQCEWVRLKEFPGSDWGISPGSELSCYPNGTVVSIEVNSDLV